MSGPRTLSQDYMDKCLHRLEELDPKKESGFRYYCRKCHTFMRRRNGIVVKPLK